MEYFKVKAKHVFHDGFNKVTLWTWIRLMALVSEIEVMPTERQMRSVVTKRELELLSSHFESEGKDTSRVLQKVLEDVESLKIEREKWKIKKRQVRVKLENVPLDISGESQAKVNINKVNTIPPPQIIGDILEFFNKTCNKNYTLNTERKKIISKKLSEGVSPDDLKKAILNFSQDDWPDRNKYCDIIYAIGKQTGKPDNFEKWINYNSAAQKREKHPEEIEHERKRQEYINKQKGDVPPWNT